MKIRHIIIFVLIAAVLGVLILMRKNGDTQPLAATNEPVVEATPTPVAATPPVELKAILSADELLLLDTSVLERLDLSGSTCYDAIEAFRAAHPDVELTYAVMIEGDGEALAVDPKTEALEIGDASYLPSLAENARWLTSLRSVTIDPDIADGAAVDALREAIPECSVEYSMHLLDELYPYDTEEITLTGLNAQQLEELIPQLERFSHLNAVNLPESENDLSAEEAIALSGKSDVICLDYQIELFGQSISLNAETIEFENTYIGNDGAEELRALLPSFKKLSYLKLDNCQIDNDTMEKLRDDFPGIKVVWRVFFGSYHCLTDSEMIWATGGSVNDNTAGVLKYCTDVKYLDLGHTLITRADFLSYMPKLEVAILAISWLGDISPIANCPDLEYLELFSARVTDLSPLAKCTHLQHLNVSSQRNSNNVPIGPTDISSLYDLPELKRFYCTMSYVPEEQQKEMMERHPDCEFEFRWVDPAEGAWRFDENGHRNERYSLLCEQFGYDTYQQSGKVWSLYG